MTPANTSGAARLSSEAILHELMPQVGSALDRPKAVECPQLRLSPEESDSTRDRELENEVPVDEPLGDEEACSNLPVARDA